MATVKGARVTVLPRTLGPTGVVVDISDCVPDPGGSVAVYCQVVDASGNGVPKAGVVITLRLTLGTGAVATLDASVLPSDANGQAFTGLSIGATCKKNSRISISGTIS